MSTLEVGSILDNNEPQKMIINPDFCQLQRATPTGNRSNLILIYIPVHESVHF